LPYNVRHLHSHLRRLAELGFLNVTERKEIQLIVPPPTFALKSQGSNDLPSPVVRVGGGKRMDE